MVGLIPHIYRYVPFKVAESESIYFKDPMYVDLYMLVKSRVFLLLTVLLLGVFVFQLTKKHISLIKDNITMGTGLFALLVILSSLMSDYQDLVYWGAKDRFEGMWVWLAYLFVFTVARHYGSNKEFVNKLLNVFVVSASIMAVFGIMQVFGYDIYTEGPLKWLCFPKEVAANMDAFITSNTTGTLAVGALFNSNYFGVYCGMASLGALFLAFRNHYRLKIGYGIIAVLAYGAMIGSRSEAALLGFAISLLVLVFSNYRTLIESKLHSVILIVAMIFMDRGIIIVLSGNQSTNARYIYLLMGAMIVLGGLLRIVFDKSDSAIVFMKKHGMVLAIVTVLVSIVCFNMAYQMMPVSSNSNLIEELVIEDNYLKLKMVDDKALKFEFLVTGVNVYDNDNQPIEAEQTLNNEMTIKTDKMSYDLKVKVYSNGYIATLSQPIDFNIFYDGATIQYVDRETGLGNIQYPKRFDYYSNKTNAFSKRGYIWGTYMPIMQEKFLTGYGVDTYLTIFPQSDFVGKHNAYTKSYSKILVDKPHSMYLMVGLATGVVGIVMLLAFIVLIIGSYYRYSILLSSNGMITILIVLFIAGIMNDSTIPLSLIMFIFGGSVLSFNEFDEEV